METFAAKKNPRWFILYFLLPALLIYTVFFIAPILDSIRLSFYDSDGLIVKNLSAGETTSNSLPNIPSKNA